MPTLKERIQSLTSSINEVKTSLSDALRNHGVDPGSQPTFEAIRLGIESIPSGGPSGDNWYKALIGKVLSSVQTWILRKPLERGLWLPLKPQSP